MKRKKDFAIWIIPSGEIYEKYHNLIYHLSQKYSTPMFEPHITLLGHVIDSQVGAISKISRLSALTRPFPLRLTSIGYSDEYFRCLFIKTRKSRELAELHSRAKEIFTLLNKRPFIPHLSLVYGNLSSIIREKIVSEIGSEFNIEFEVRSLQLVSASISIDPKEWYRVKEFPLT